MNNEEKLLRQIRLLFLESQLKGTMGDSKPILIPFVKEFKKTLDEHHILNNGLVGVLDEMFTHDNKEPMSIDMYKQGLALAYPDAEDTTKIEKTFAIPKPDDGKVEISQLKKIVKRTIKMDNLTKGMTRYSLMLSKNPDEIEE
jgi:hypothetical protein